MLRIGLRFRRGDARVLHAVAERVRAGELSGGADVFANAALAAKSGEPLIVLCDHPDEAKQMAAGYALHGIRPPVIEPLN